MTNDDRPKKARALGMNHVALEVGDIDEALAFYGNILEFSLRSRSARAAFIDLGDQFIALSAGRHQGPMAAEYGQFAKINLPDGCERKIVPVAVGFGYYRSGFDGYLGGVG
jgi:catechol 2,3-dioxygenase-like lactoylglutathione lyase family enzyme